jgi:hypothetical protein
MHRSRAGHHAVEVEQEGGDVEPEQIGQRLLVVGVSRHVASLAFAPCGRGTTAAARSCIPTRRHNPAMPQPRQIWKEL